MPTHSEESERIGAGARAPVSERQPSTLAEAAELWAVATLVSGETADEWIAFTPAPTHADEDDSEGGGGPLRVIES